MAIAFSQRLTRREMRRCLIRSHGHHLYVLWYVAHRTHRITYHHPHEDVFHIHKHMHAVALPRCLFQSGSCAHDIERPSGLESDKYTVKLRIHPTAKMILKGLIEFCHSLLNDALKVYCIERSCVMHRCGRQKNIVLSSSNRVLLSYLVVLMNRFCLPKHDNDRGNQVGKVSVEDSSR